MEFQELSNQNQNQLKKSLFFEKGAKGLLFMRSAYERVNGACEFERIGVKKG